MDVRSLQARHMLSFKGIANWLLTDLFLVLAFSRGNWKKDIQATPYPLGAYPTEGGRFIVSYTADRRK